MIFLWNNVVNHLLTETLEIHHARSATFVVWQRTTKKTTISIWDYISFSLPYKEGRNIHNKFSLLDVPRDYLECLNAVCMHSSSTCFSGALVSSHGHSERYFVPLLVPSCSQTFTCPICNRQRFPLHNLDGGFLQQTVALRRKFPHVQ